MRTDYLLSTTQKFLSVAILFLFVSTTSAIRPAEAGNLEEVLQTGTLKHLGIPYANFVTRDHMGLDVELMQQFAKYLGVKYQFVGSSWQNIIPELTGKKITVKGDTVEITGTTSIKGDVISTGFTILPWRRQLVDFSAKTFPSGIWLIARSDAPLTPIKPTGDIEKDILRVKKKLMGISVLGLEGSCLAPELYGIDQTGAKIQFFPIDHDLEGMIPSIIAKIADTTLMDVPVALIALSRWPRQIKVIGPLSDPQSMACAFSKDSPKLKQAFDSFFNAFQKSGKYKELVNTYYPTVFTYYPEFLSQQ